MLGKTFDAGNAPRRMWARWLLAVVLAAAWCAASGATPRSLRFDRLSIEQGLSQESVLNVLQDRQGFMWFGTQAGLNRFDGYKTTVFRNDPQDPGSIVDNYVLASFEDAQGRLWFGTKGGLTRFDPASQRFIRYAPEGVRAGARNRAVNAIVADGHGGLWLATGDGLKHFDPATERFTALRHDPRDGASLRDDRVNALATDHQGALWVGTADGLDRLAAGARRFEHFAIEPASDPGRNTVLALSMGPRETLWIGTAAGLEAWRLGSGTVQRSHVDLAAAGGEGRILAVYHDRGANLWVGTEFDGLKWRDPASGTFVSYRSVPLDGHSLSDNQVSAVFVDRSGTLWAGTLFGGVNRADLASGGFSRFSFPSAAVGGSGNGKVRAITDGPDGRLWLGTTGGGLVLLDPATGAVTQLRHDPANRASLPNDVVTALTQAGGRLWVGTPTGLSWRDPASGKFTQVPLGGADSNADHVQALRPGRDGTLWIVTRGGLLALAPDGRTLQRWRHDPRDQASLGEDYGFALLEDRHGALWIGTDNGLDRFDRATGKFTHFRHDPADPASLRHSRVYYLLESSRGELWVGTAGGLHRLQTGADGKAGFRLFRVTDGKTEVPIGGVLEDATGALWVSNTVGISRLDPASGAFKSYTAKDGLIDGSYFVGSAWKANGLLHFGGITGMTSFMPEAVHDNPYPPAVVITGFTVGNRSRTAGGALPNGQEVTLSYRDTVFSLEFAALHYADPQGNRYSYRLEGFDEGWVAADAAKRFATYTNLDPGRYVFRVRASNKDGVWSDTPATLAITIAPPFWKTWWFRTLAALVLLGAAYWGYRLRVRGLVQQKRLLAREVEARTAELRQQKEALERRNVEIERQKEVVELAHHQLQETQAQLAAHEKLASLGSLVAGVAHELNTPIGNSLLMASTLHEKTEQLAQRFEQSTLRRSDLAGWIDASREASGLIVRSLHNAAELVNSFKQVSVDQSSAQRRRFDLAQACNEIAATMMNRVRRDGHTLELQVPAGIVLDAYPGSLGQVLINFVNNALLHAFDGPGGRMVLAASTPEPGRVRIEFSDNGRGIAPDHVARIFDPFFTTRMGQGGTGLGLNIAWNLVTTLLGGAIRVDSTPGHGTTFILDLPLQAPGLPPDITTPIQGAHA
jgi:ligand-binding sensor domain-containing protein/signal transduction histidine kinase